MSHRHLIILPFEEEDLEEARLWYEDHEPRLGEEFLAAVDQTFERLMETLLAFAIVRRQVRRCLLHRFPYGIFYAVEPERIVVFAVMHASRSPSQWKRRL